MPLAAMQAEYRDCFSTSFLKNQSQMTKPSALSSPTRKAEKDGQSSFEPVSEFKIFSNNKHCMKNADIKIEIDLNIS